jgi:hypothetical protein
LASQPLNSSTHSDPSAAPPSTATSRPPEIKNDSSTVELGFSVDHDSNALKIKVTNQVSGEVVREFEIKGMSSAHHDPVNSKGVIVDDRT